MGCRSWPWKNEDKGPSLRSEIRPIGIRRGWLRVERRELILIRAEDVTAADLECRRQLSGVDLERAAEQEEGPDSLGLTDRLHDPIDPLGEKGPERRGRDHLA